MDLPCADLNKSPGEVHFEDGSAGLLCFLLDGNALSYLNIVTGLDRS